MNYFRCSDNDFGTMRNLVIGEIVRKTGYPLSRALELTYGDVVFDDDSIMVGNVLIQNVPTFVIDYLKRRGSVFSNTNLLFPTLDGRPLHPAKYSKQLQGMLKSVGLEEVGTHPNSLKTEHWKKIETILYQKRHTRSQVVLAGVLCAYLGLRPSEVAKLYKHDLDFAGLLITLRDTKSQVTQEVPILPFMIAPLKQYVSHLKENDPLFVTKTGLQWDRSNTHNAIVTYGKEIGLEGQITPRRLRASLGKKLSDFGAPPALIGKLLRHKDPATSLRYYMQSDFAQVRKYLLDIEENQSPSNSETENDFGQMIEDDGDTNE